MLRFGHDQTNSHMVINESFGVEDAGLSLIATMVLLTFQRKILNSTQFIHHILTI